MSEKKYVAYVGSYTHGSSRQGIHVYDLGVEKGSSVLGASEKRWSGRWIM